MVAAAAQAAAVSAAVAYALFLRRQKTCRASEHQLSDGTNVVIRDASRLDVADVYKLIHSLAVVCGEGHEMMVGLDGITAAFDRNAFDALVATSNGTVVGMAIIQESFRTFTGSALYLQDLIVADSHRGLGLGTLLFQSVASSAVRRGCNRLFWESVDDNHKANAFYAGAIGAEQVTCHLNWRIEGEVALEALAQKAGLA